MTETVRFGLIGKQDIKIGTGTFEARLADGRVVVLDEIRLTDFLSALTVGSVLFVKSGGVAGEDNSNLFWDDTNNRLGIGTASPSQPLHVVGIILSEANLTFQSGTAFVGTLDHAITAARTWTLPDSTDTVVLLAATQTLTGKTLLATGSGNVVMGILDRDVSAADIVNTISETVVYSFTLPGGTLSTNRAVRLTVIGDYLNNSTNSAILRIQVNYGTQEPINMTTDNLEQHANRRAFIFETLLCAANATNAQVALGNLAMSGPGTANALAGAGQIGVHTRSGVVLHSGLTVDSTANQTLTVSFEHDVADANISARAHVVLLEVLR